VPEIDLETTGFTLPETEQLIASLLPDSDPDEQEFLTDEESGPCITQPGDLITLGLHGEHRVLCGDVTKPTDLTTLMGEFRAQLCHTDPPYGVRYDRTNRPAPKQTRAKGGRSDPIRNDDLTPKRYAAWFTKVVAQIHETLVPGAPYYI
jgi:hypothetical protein